MAAPHSHSSVVGNGWRVKLYELEPEGAWVDKGTGYVACRILAGLGCPGLIVTNEDNPNDVLLRSRIRFDENYELQGENIIMWREMSDNNVPESDYALSFQEAVGCNQIWEAISEIQNQTGEGITRHGSEGYESHMMHVEELYSNTNSPAAGPQPYIVLPVQCTTLESLTLARDKLNNMFPGQRDFAIAQLTENDFQYIQELFAMFIKFEESNDKDGLSRMAEVFRSICLLNDSGLLEYFFSSDEILSKVVHVFEYDHTLAARAQYREYLFKAATLKEVVPHSSSEMTQAMTFLFRLKYFRDIILHPAVDEPGISALSSMIMFSSSDICYKLFENSGYLSRILKVIKPSLDITSYYSDDPRANSTCQTEELTRVNTSVTTLSDGAAAMASASSSSSAVLAAAAAVAAGAENSDTSSLQCEVHASAGEDSDGSSSSSSGLSDSSESDEVPSAKGNNSGSSSGGGVEKKVIVPLSVEAVAANNRQLSPRSSKDLVLKFPNPLHASVSKCLSMDEDSVLSTATDIIATPQQVVHTVVLPRASPVDAARFLRELFFLSKSLIMEKRSELFRMFFESLKKPFMEVLLFIFGYHVNYTGFVCPACDIMVESELTQCHSLLCEVLAGIVVVCPSQIRKIILAEPVVVVPLINTALPLRDVTKVTYHHSLLFLMMDIVVNSNDAASIDQMGDAMKTLLDHDKTPGNAPSNPADASLSKAQLLQQAMDNTEKDSLIALYYEHYITWLFAPFHDENTPDRSVPDSFYASRGLEIRHQRQMSSALVASRRMIFENLIQGICQHSYRMKYYIMRNAGIISKCLTKVFSKEVCNANKWLHVYASKFIRAILSTKDEFYVKHIEKTDLMRPLLTHLKTSRCKDNMFTSCIYELVDYIRLQNIKMLILYIVNKFSDCFVECKSNVFDQLKVRYDQIMDGKDEPPSSDSSLGSSTNGTAASYNTILDKTGGNNNMGGVRNDVALKARQKRLREVDNEDDYFFGEDDDDDDDTASKQSGSTNQTPAAERMRLSTTAALAKTKLNVTAEDRAKLVVVGSQKPIYASYFESGGVGGGKGSTGSTLARHSNHVRGNLYSSNRILGGQAPSGSNAGSSSGSSSSGSGGGRNFSAGQPVHGSNGRLSPYRLTGSLSTGEVDEEEEDDGEDAWFCMNPSPSPPAAAAAVLLSSSSGSPTPASVASSAIAAFAAGANINDENASTASSVASYKRQKANDGSSVSRQPLSPLGEGGEGQSGASALFSMLSEYGNNDEEEGSGGNSSTSGVSGATAASSGLLRPVPARTHRSLIVDIYDDAMTSLRKDSMSSDSVIGRLERGIDLRSARSHSEVSASFSDAEDSVMTHETSGEMDHRSPDRSGLPPLKSKFGDDEDEEDATIFSGHLKRPAVGSPGGSISTGANKMSSQASKHKTRHPVIQFKTTTLDKPSAGDSKGHGGGEGATSSVAVGGSGVSHM